MTNAVEQGQGVEVGIKERLPFVGSEREVVTCDLVWESLLKMFVKADAEVSPREHACHGKAQSFCSTCGMRL